MTAPADRLPEDTDVGRVRLLVEDLDRALEFWRDLLGLRAARREPGLVGLAAPAARPTGPADTERSAAAPKLITLLLEEPPDRHRLPPLGPDAGLYHLALRVPGRADLGRFLARLRARGVPYGASDHAVSEALYLKDPDGHGVEVYADRPRRDWRQKGGELVMVTEPLDEASLLRAAAEESTGGGSSGLPAGTVMGHVHLRVGDLDRARAFYHEALGLDLTVWSYPGALFFSAGGYHHHLGVNNWPGPGGGVDRKARLVDWELRVPGGDALRRLVDRLTARGFPPAPAADGWAVADPEGIALRLTEARDVPTRRFPA